MNAPVGFPIMYFFRKEKARGAFSANTFAYQYITIQINYIPFEIICQMNF